MPRIPSGGQWRRTLSGGSFVTLSVGMMTSSSFFGAGRRSDILDFSLGKDLGLNVLTYTLASAHNPVIDLFKIELENEDVFMAPVFDEFCQCIVLRSRGANAGEIEIEYRGVELNANGMNIKVPVQLFIDGKFVDAEDQKTTDVINPSDETVTCKVS